MSPDYSLSKNYTRDSSRYSFKLDSWSGTGFIVDLETDKSTYRTTGEEAKEEALHILSLSESDFDSYCEQALKDFENSEV